MQNGHKDKAKIGIAGLDNVLVGGLSRGRVFLLEGSPGAGKTTIALQFLIEGAKLGERCLYVTLSETEEELREGAEALAAEMRARGREGGEEGESGGRERDPLGRPTSGSADGGSETRVPTEGDPVRAREIFDEIRRRAQDPNRPAAEREYLRRLLDRFGDSGS